MTQSISRADLIARLASATIAIEQLATETAAAARTEVSAAPLAAMRSREPSTKMIEATAKLIGQHRRNIAAIDSLLSAEARDGDLRSAGTEQPALPAENDALDERISDESRRAMPPAPPVAALYWSEKPSRETPVRPEREAPRGRRRPRSRATGAGRGRAERVAIAVPFGWEKILEGSGLSFPE